MPNLRPSRWQMSGSFSSLQSQHPKAAHTCGAQYERGLDSQTLNTCDSPHNMLAGHRQALRSGPFAIAPDGRQHTCNAQTPRPNISPREGPSWPRGVWMMTERECTFACSREGHVRATAHTCSTPLETFPPSPAAAGACVCSRIEQRGVKTRAACTVHRQSAVNTHTACARYKPEIHSSTHQETG